MRWSAALGTGQSGATSDGRMRHFRVGMGGRGDMSSSASHSSTAMWGSATTAYNDHDAETCDMLRGGIRDRKG